jgi:hypothetical protein
MSLIQYIIPNSKSDEICESLTKLLRDEFANQLLLSPTNYIYNAEIENDRFTPFSNPYNEDGTLIKSDSINTKIVVHFTGFDVLQTNPEYQRVKGKFAIRINHRLIENEISEGSEISQRDVKKLALIVRYILQSKEHYYLIPSGINGIHAKKVTGIQIESVFRTDSTINETSAQVDFEAEYNEVATDLTTYPVSGVDAITNNDIKITVPKI